MVPKRSVPSPHRTRQGFGGILIFIAGVITLAPSAAGDDGDSRSFQVLLLHSYRPHVTYTKSQQDAILAAFEVDGAPDSSVRIEYLDIATRNDPAYQDSLATHFCGKYGEVVFDLVITTDTPAYDFIRTYGTSLFPAVPVVFSALQAEWAATGLPSGEITGAMESIDIEATLDLAFRLHPRTRNVAVITEQSAYGRRLRALTSEYLDGLSPRVRSTWLSDLPIDELTARLRVLAEDTIVLYLSCRDPLDQGISGPALLRRLAPECPRPIYGLYDSYLGTGIVGGRVSSGEYQGRAAASLAFRVLRGEPASQIPLITGPNPYMLDWAAIQRFGIREADLPAGSVIINQPLDVWGRHKWTLISAVAALLAQTGIIILLFAQYRRRLRAEQLARRSELFAEGILDSISANVSVLDDEGSIIAVNAAWRTFAEENSLPAGDHAVGANYLEVCRRVNGRESKDALAIAGAIRDILAGRAVELRLAYPCHTPRRRRWFQTQLSLLRAPDDGRPMVVVAHEEITALHAVSEALQCSEERYRLLVEGADVIVWEADANTFNCTYVSARAESLLGFPVEQWYEPGFWLSRVHAEDRERVDIGSRERVARGEAHRLEYRMLAADGRIVWFEDLVSVEMRDGAPAQIRGVMIDITQRVSSQQALVESEKRYRRIVTTALEGIWLVNADWKTTFVNDAMAEMLGVTPAEMMGRHVFEFMDEAGIALARVNMARREQGINEVYDFRFKRRDGSDVWVIISTSALHDDQGRFAGALGMCTDITTRKRAEQALAESEELFRVTFEQAAVGICRVDPKGRFLEVNAALCHLLGYSAEALRERTFVDVTHPDDVQKNMDLYHSALRGERHSYTMEKRYIRADGGVVWADLCVSLVRDDAGRPKYFISVVQDLASRKAAEQALADREARLRTILDSEPECVKTVGLDGRLLDMNPAGLRMIEADSLEQVVGAPLVDLVDPADRAAFERFHADAASGRIGLAQYRTVGLRGTPRWMESHAAPLRGPDGRIVAVISVTRDLSQRREMEARLRESEQRYRVLFEANQAGVFYSMPSGQVRGCNEAFARIFGFASVEEAMATPAVEYYESPECRERYLSELREKRCLCDYELSMRRRDGSRIWLLENVQLLHLSEGQEEMIFGTLIDITARKRAEEALLEAQESLEERVRQRTAELAESEQRFRQLHEAAFEGIAIHESGRIIEANNALLAIFGYARKELIGRNLLDLIAPGSPGPDGEPRDADPAEAARESQGIRSDGVVFPIELREKAMPARNRRVRVVAIRDIGARKSAEERAGQHQEELAHVLRLSTLGEMASGLAHELNQPLGAIVNYTQGCVRRLEAGAAQPEEIITAMRQTASQAQRAGQIIKRMREFVRKREPLQAPTDLNAIVRRAVGLMEAETKKRHVAMRLRLSSDLPAIMADEIQVEQVVLNLLKNACEALAGVPANRRRIIMTTQAGADGSVDLRVSDSGPGLALDLVDRAFDPFVSTKADGMGMGLSISRSIVEAHGGKLSLAPGGEGGATFLLTLPVTVGELKHEPGEAPSDSIRCG